MPPLLQKLLLLASAAKYDVSCSSSGATRTSRNNSHNSLGNTNPWGICHSFTQDGRCVSLLKIMLTNHCIYDCAYCANRRSNDLPRTTLSVSELVQLTLEFYRRNYIEGLFLSSGIVRNPDYTMERLVRVAQNLRQLHHYNGYIHLKTIPGASRELITQAGKFADRLSCNIELPSERSLQLIAPDKNYQAVFQPMHYIQQNFLQTTEDRRKFPHTPPFAPAGQSTQMIIGASTDDDNKILHLSSALYQRPAMKRVYYSAYIHINTYDTRLPALPTPPLLRENRLYQADWLMRYYHFTVDEIVNDNHPTLELEIDPKLSWALRNPHHFPVDINTADYEILLRIPGVGLRSAQMIIASRKFGRLTTDHLRKMGVVLKRAKYFITSRELPSNTPSNLSSNTPRNLSPEHLRHLLTKKKTPDPQLPIPF